MLTKIEKYSNGYSPDCFLLRLLPVIKQIYFLKKQLFFVKPIVSFLLCLLRLPPELPLLDRDGGRYRGGHQPLHGQSGGATLQDLGQQQGVGVLHDGK